MCVLSCTFRLLVHENDCPQVLQENGFVCILSWPLSAFESVNDLPHISQVKGFTPVYSFMRFEIASTWK